MPTVEGREARVWIDEYVKKAGKLSGVAKMVRALVKKARRSEVRALLEQAAELNRKEPVTGTKVQMKQSRAAGTRKSGRRAMTPD